MDVNQIFKYLQLIQALIAMWAQFQNQKPAAQKSTDPAAQKAGAHPTAAPNDAQTVSALTNISKQIAPNLPDAEHAKLAAIMASLVAS